MKTASSPRLPRRLGASLDPSIGNWSSPWGSHYWIKRNTVRWAGSLTEEQVQAGRARETRTSSGSSRQPNRLAPPSSLAAPGAS